MSHGRFGDTVLNYGHSDCGTDDDDYYNSEEYKRERMLMRKIWITTLVVGIVVFFVSGWFSLLSTRSWLLPDSDTLRVTCKLVDINGTHEWKEGGHLGFMRSSFPINLWVATITKSVLCKEVTHPSNTHLFTYHEYYLNLTQIDMESLLSVDVANIDKEYDRWYYGEPGDRDDGFMLIGRGVGSASSYNIGDIYSLSDEPLDPYESYYSTWIMLLAMRFGFASVWASLAALILLSVSMLRKRL
jgi:hypothetical protein